MAHAVLHVSDTIKLRGHPKALSTKLLWKHSNGRGNDLGYSKNLKDVTMDNPQPSSKGLVPTSAVHRLNVGGPFRVSRGLERDGIRYSRALVEMQERICKD